MIAHLPEEVKFTHYLLVQLFGYMSWIIWVLHEYEGYRWCCNPALDISSSQQRIYEAIFHYGLDLLYFPFGPFNYIRNHNKVLVPI